MSFKISYNLNETYLVSIMQSARLKFSLIFFFGAFFPKERAILNLLKTTATLISTIIKITPKVEPKIIGSLFVSRHLSAIN